MQFFLKHNQDISMKSYIIKIIEQEKNTIANKNLSMVNLVNDIENSWAKI